MRAIFPHSCLHQVGLSGIVGNWKAQVSNDLLIHDFDGDGDQFWKTSVLNNNNYDDDNINNNNKLHQLITLDIIIGATK